MTAPVIRTSGLGKDYDGVPAIQDVNLDVREGSVCGLAGPNGAGKTTLLGLVAGALRPSAGKALVCGRQVFDSPEAKAHVAWIPSDPFFFSQESIDGMARFYRAAFPTFEQERFERLAKSFELDRKARIRKMSKGMRRQVAFWLTLSLRSDVLLLDEPMDGLDPLVRHRMWQLVLGEVAERGLTVLASTHNLRELEGVCDQLAIMDKGRLVRQIDLAGGSADYVKVQVVLPEGVDVPASLDAAHEQSDGRMRTLIVHGTAERVRQVMAPLDPIYLELVPLSLEELFLYELGGTDNDLDDPLA